MSSESEMVELREFICKHCAHTVVVKPGLPPDYEPNICCECWDEIEAPKQRAWEQKFAKELRNLLTLCGAAPK